MAAVNTWCSQQKIRRFNYIYRDYTPQTGQDGHILYQRDLSLPHVGISNSFRPFHVLPHTRVKRGRASCSLELGTWYFFGFESFWKSVKWSKLTKLKHSLTLRSKFGFIFYHYDHACRMSTVKDFNRECHTYVRRVCASSPKRIKTSCPVLSSSVPLLFFGAPLLYAVRHSKRNDNV